MTRVLVEQSGRVLHLINNAPEKRNALDYDYYDGILAALDAAGDDVGAVVLSGANHFFCAGGDLKGLKKRSEQDFAGPAVAFFGEGLVADAFVARFCWITIRRRKTRSVFGT